MSWSEKEYPDLAALLGEVADEYMAREKEGREALIVTVTEALYAD